MLRQVVTFWIETWHNNKKLFLAEMLGTISGMAAATVLAIQSPNPDLVTVFILYTISAMCFIYSNYIRRSAWMITLMLFYMVTNAVGLTQAL